MPDTPTTVPKGRLARLGRFLARSRMGQCAVATTILAFFVGLVWLIWWKRDWAAFVLAAVVIDKGLRLAGRWLPISAATRARWTEEKRLAEGHPAFFWQELVWYGPFFLLLTLWQAGSEKWSNRSEFAAAILSTLVGLICIVICHRYARKKLAAND